MWWVRDIIVVRVVTNQDIWAAWTLMGGMMGVTTMLTQYCHLQKVVERPQLLAA